MNLDDLIPPYNVMRRALAMQDRADYIAFRSENDPPPPRCTSLTFAGKELGPVESIEFDGQRSEPERPLTAYVKGVAFGEDELLRNRKVVQQRTGKQFVVIVYSLDELPADLIDDYEDLDIEYRVLKGPGYGDLCERMQLKSITFVQNHAEVGLFAHRFVRDNAEYAEWQKLEEIRNTPQTCAKCGTTFNLRLERETIVCVDCDRVANSIAAPVGMRRMSITLQRHCGLEITDDGQLRAFIPMFQTVEMWAEVELSIPISPNIVERELARIVDFERGPSGLLVTFALKLGSDLRRRIEAVNYAGLMMKPKDAPTFRPIGEMADCYRRFMKSEIVNTH